MSAVARLVDVDLAEVGNSIYQQREEARVKAIDSLARYKFAMFSYWAGIWVHLNRAIGDGQPNPFAELVKKARELRNVQPLDKQQEAS